MNIGVIGTGNMGTILISSFIDSCAVKPSHLTIVNRSIEKASALKKQYPAVYLAENAKEVVCRSDILFICVKPHEYFPLLKRIRPSLRENHLVVSITSPIKVSELEAFVSCDVARAIPSITNRALSGASLVTFGSHCSESNKEKLLYLMSQISTPIETDEEVTRVSSDIASCGPAFLSFLIQQFIEGAVAETEISTEQATVLATEMLIGMGKLLEKDYFSLETLQKKVSVKGGVTGEGLNVLEKETGDMFNKLIKRTHKKFDEDRRGITVQFKEESRQN
ncbi:late competence protein ComER [Pseudalkalibacillus hwajinpoensis]|uniref:late competence protein ComER n=1 Tax=Guptibacillus hwajinpoensis TaxID=208199 RepID=UPI00325B26D9